MLSIHSNREVFLQYFFHKMKIMIWKKAFLVRWKKNWESEARKYVLICIACLLCHLKHWTIVMNELEVTYKSFVILNIVLKLKILKKFRDWIFDLVYLTIDTTTIMLRQSIPFLLRERHWIKGGWMTPALGFLRTWQCNKTLFSIFHFRFYLHTFTISYIDLTP